MMEAGELAEAAAIILGFHAHALTATGGASANEDGPPPAGRDEAHIIWAALEPAGEPDVYEAVRAVAREPGEATMGALRARLGELFVENPDLAGRIEALIAQSGYASLVGQDAQEWSPQLGRGLPTGYFQKLARLRRAFTILFVAAALLSVGAGRVLGASFAGPGLFFIAQGMRASVAWYYGQRLRLPGAIWLGLAAFIPGSFWPIFFTIRGWRPETLSTPASGRDRLEPWVKGAMTAFASLSLILFAIMLLGTASYLIDLLINWFGLILLAVWLMLYVPGIIGLRRWYWKGQGDNGWQFGLVAALLSVGNLVGIFVALLGPALVRLIDQLR
jgi:hypothetical protein